jgi:purine nucleosidase
MQKIHLDTDLGGDTDDLCALALLLSWPEVEITGITTCIEQAGRRAGYVEYALRLAGREGIPVAAGADGGLEGLRVVPDYPDEAAMWPEPVAPHPSRPGAALDLLDASVDQGASVVAVGPYTNLALYEALRPGRLVRVPVVLMGGWLGPLPAGMPNWDANGDWNMQEDVAAARRLLRCCRPTLVPVAATVQTHLRAGDLPRIRRAGPLAELLARQAEAHAAANDMAALGARYAGLPNDLLNFQHDPLACAVALGWDGVRIEELPLQSEIEDGWLVTRVDPDGIRLPVVTGVDGERFNRFWLDTVAPQRLGG